MVYNEMNESLSADKDQIPQKTFKNFDVSQLSRRKRSGLNFRIILGLVVLSTLSTLSTTQKRICDKKKKRKKINFPNLLAQRDILRGRGQLQFWFLVLYIT